MVVEKNMVNGFFIIDGLIFVGKFLLDKYFGKIDVGYYMYSFYFKGLVSEDLLVGFGVVIMG